MELVLTLVSPDPGALPAAEAAVDQALARASLPVKAHEPLGPGAVDLYLEGDVGGVRKLALDALAHHATDAAVQFVAERRKGLLLADMDSTIINVECLDELADYAGVKAQVAEITERAMRGELEFEGALRERVGMLKGLSLSALQAAYDERVRLNPGARRLIRTMAEHGARCVLVSGGFTFFTSRVAEAAGFHANRANTPIGDGANDLAMIEAAGLGVAYRAKPIVAAQADAKVDHADLTALLYFQGYRADQFVVD
jgi:phosphoserine phosphatase